MSKQKNNQEILFFIHGGYVNSWVWKKYVKFFKSKGYKCIAPTLPYHEEKYLKKPNNKLAQQSILDYEKFLENKIKKLPKKPIIIGHSMGGILAQMLATKNLHKKLILLTPVPPYGITGLNYNTIKTYFRTFSTWKFWQKPIYLNWQECQYSSINLCEPKVQKEIFRHFGFESGKAAVEFGLWLFDKNKSTKIVDNGIKGEILVIAGKQDRMVAISVAKKIAKKYNAEYKEFSNHAHYLIMEPGWEKIAEYIHNWINK